MFRNACTLALLWLAPACGGTSTTDAAVDAAPTDSVTDDITQLDTAPPDGSNSCVAAHGVCVGARNGCMSFPGFSFECPAGTALANGATGFCGPGSDLVGGSIPGGCGQLMGCCYPAEAGDASADATADVADVARDVSSDAPSSDIADATGSDVADAAGTDAADTSASDAGDLATACMNTFGTVGTGLCCGSTSDFPNSCLTGACGCAPSASHTVRVCNCPGASTCWNGHACVAR